VGRVLNDGGQRVMSDAIPIAPVRLTSGERRALAALALAAVVCVAVYLAAGSILTRQDEFWSPDSAIRFVQMESLRRAGFRDVVIPYPPPASILKVGSSRPARGSTSSGTAGIFCLICRTFPRPAVSSTACLDPPG
jgi:hypothetical protein